MLKWWWGRVTIVTLPLLMFTFVTLITFVTAGVYRIPVH